jgi:uncharacterized protein (DUF427 family)
MKAVWKGRVIAESNHTVLLEGNHYFPEESVNMEYLEKSNSHTTCPWKGEASYYSIRVNESINPDSAWYYPHPSDLAKNIKGYMAFWKGVKIKN